MTTVVRPSARLLLAVPLIAAALAIAALLVESPKASLALDPRAAACGVSIAGSIKEQFALGRAQDYRLRLPKMGISPELETAQPAFVVIYDGTTTLLGLSIAPPGQDANGNMVASATAPPTQYPGVVCVVINGAPVVYVNVDTSQ